MHQQHAVAILTDYGCYPVVHFVTRRALFASVAVCRDYSENWLKVVAAAISLVAMISAATVELWCRTLPVFCIALLVWILTVLY